MYQSGELGNAHRRKIGGAHPQKFPLAGWQRHQPVFMLQKAVFPGQLGGILLLKRPVEQSRLPKQQGFYLAQVVAVAGQQRQRNGAGQRLKRSRIDRQAEGGGERVIESRFPMLPRYMEQVFDALRELEDLVARSTSGAPPTRSLLDVLEKQRQDYVMASQREVHCSILEGDVDAAPALSKIQLF